MEKEKNTQTNENKEELKEEKKTKKPILWIAIVIILLIIICVLLLKDLPKQSNSDKEMSCIGENSVLVASKGCGYCHNQIEMFGDNENCFNIIYCDEDEQFCIDNQIAGVPTWIINGEKFVGLRTIDELKELTGC